MLDCRYDVVLVHPERFCFSKSNLHQLERLAQLPIGLQVNAGGLLRWGTRRLALDLLQLAGMPLLGSDCHNLTSRPPNLKEGRKVIMQKLGEAFLTRMDQNAQRLTSPRRGGLMSRYGRKRIGRRDMLKAAGALAAVLAALGGGAYLLQRLDEEENAASTASYTINDHRAEAELKEVTWNGKTYRQRPGLETYLLMGVGHLRRRAGG